MQGAPFFGDVSFSLVAWNIGLKIWRHAVCSRADISYLSERVKFANPPLQVNGRKNRCIRWLGFVG
jgi:hypothetical protein